MFKIKLYIHIYITLVIHIQIHVMYCTCNVNVKLGTCNYMVYMKLYMADTFVKLRRQPRALEEKHNDVGE